VLYRRHVKSLDSYTRHGTCTVDSAG
jgi:hypothetical protein